MKKFASLGAFACLALAGCAGAPAAAPTVDVVGMNAQALADDLEALGFDNIIYNSDTGKTVLLLSNWTVTSIDNPGVKQH